MRIRTAVLLAAVSLAAPGHPVAAGEPDTPQQIRVTPYSPLTRTQIIGIVGQPTTITFPRGEAVYRVVQSSKVNQDGSLADAGWEGASPAEVKDTPLGNNLTLWPVVPGQSTMTVITKVIEGGDQKVYPFRLVAVPDNGTADGVVTLNLIFQGQGAPARKPPASAGRPVPAETATAAAQWRDEQAEIAIAKARLRVDAFNGSGGGRAGEGGCHCVAKGTRPNAVTPRCPLDNGEWTLMRFPGLSRKPAVYVGTCDTSSDNERLARQHESGDFVVVEEIAPRFCLRLGDDILEIINQAFDPAGRPGGGGTVAPSVARDVIAAKSTPR